MSRQSQQYSSKNTWNAAIPASEVACRSSLPQERAPGVKWCAVEDLPSLKPVRSEFPNTKRGVLSTTSSLFEPLGLAAPYVIKAKPDYSRTLEASDQVGWSVAQRHSSAVASLEERFEDFAAYRSSLMVRLPSSWVPKRAVTFVLWCFWNRLRSSCLILYGDVWMC